MRFFNRLIDVNLYDGSFDHCFLYCYRALCHEVYQKEAAIRVSGELKQNADKGLTVDGQLAVQRQHSIQTNGARHGLKVFRKLKTLMDDQLTSGKIKGWSRFVLEFEGPINFATAGVMNPNRDYYGNELQTLHSVVGKMETLIIASGAKANGGAIICLWRTSEACPSQFLASLFKNNQNCVQELIAQVVFAHLENTYFSHSFWTSLTSEISTHLRYLASLPNPYYTDFCFKTQNFLKWNNVSIVNDSI